jgi:hypothetical protein
MPTLPNPEDEVGHMRMEPIVRKPQDRDFMNPFSRTLTLPNVEKPENWKLDPDIQIPEEWKEKAGESGDREERVERALEVVNEATPEIRQWRNALVDVLRRALAATTDTTITIMRGITRNGIRISQGAGGGDHQEPRYLNWCSIICSLRCLHYTFVL